MSDYNFYEEIRENALRSDATQSDINRLGDWFSQFGGMYWNGEYYDADDGVRVYPVYKEVEEDEYELIGWEIK